METSPLYQQQTIPESFLDGHYSQMHVAEALGIDEPEFWGLYVAGLIPRGVSLMALTGIPLIVWPRELLDEWNRTGRPAEPGALELQSQVLHSLIAAFEAAGIEFPSYPPCGPELN